MHDLKEYLYGFLHPSIISIVLLVFSTWAKKSIDNLYDKINGSCSREELEVLKNRTETKILTLEKKMTEINEYMLHLNNEIEKIELKFDFIKEQFEKISSKIDDLLKK
jgi:peptidoglycan hydrolase CwlO-like protein